MDKNHKIFREQKLTSWTTIRFDFWDRMRVLFGGEVHVEVVIIVPIEEEIKTYNASSKCWVDGLTKFSIKQDRNTYGMMTVSPKRK